MKRTSILIGILFFLSVDSISSQDLKDDKKTFRTEKPSDGMKNIQLAIQLVQYGYKNESAIALIEAAQIFTKYPSGKLDAKSTESTGEKNNKKKEKKQVNNFDVQQLLTDAKNFAKDNEPLLSVIDGLKKNKTRGAYYGAIEVDRRVYPRGQKVDYITFTGGELGEIAIAGDGDNDLDLYVYNANGLLIAKSEDYTDICYVSFYPPRTQQYKIIVVNRGKRYYSDYVLITN